MKTKEELNALKEEVETLNKKLHELTDEELEQVAGGKKSIKYGTCPICNKYVEILHSTGRYYGSCGHEWE